MSRANKIIAIAKENNGIITSSMLDELGISRTYLKHLVDQNKLKRCDRGVYLLNDSCQDDYFTVQNQYRRGIFSKETALYLHGLISKAPNKISMTFPDNYNLTNAKEKDLKPCRAKDSYYNLGIIEMKSPLGQVIKVYDVEKTLCDILRPRSGVKEQVIKTVMLDYFKSENKNIDKLLKYAKELKVESQINKYLDVLLIE